MFTTTNESNEKRKIIMNFIKNVLATVVGIFIFLFISFFVLIVIGSLASLGSNTKVTAKSNSVINLDLSQVSNDYGGRTYIEDFQFSDKNSNGLVDVLNAIEYAKTDDKIKGIKIFNPQSNLGLSQTRELRSKINEFKKTGKFVVAYADVYSQGQYYLSSVADTVYINPVGEFELKGLSSEVLYMKDLQAKTGIKFEVIRHGKYKSAVEPFLEQHMSKENREQVTELLNSVWDTYITDIATTRKLSVDTLNAVTNRLGARTPELAKKEQLVDKIAYADEFDNGIRKALGVDYTKKYNEIDVLDYVQVAEANLKNRSKKEAVAVIYAQGEIRGGEGSAKVIGEGAINRALFEARNNENIKAVVLRVNSPGGSALTSDLILREIALTKKVKPVIVSMGDVAASGGYYIASNADRIFAEPTTITGSIGVFGMIPNFKAVADKLGVNAEQVVTHDNAMGYSAFEEMDPKYKALITEDIERVYTTFLNHVSEGRKMSYDQVNDIAQGRVWTGKMAQKIGLVDELGSLQDAIAYAAKKVNLEDYRIISYPEYKIKFSELMAGLLGIKMQQTQENMIVNKIGYDNYQLLQNINYLNQSQGVQAIMPYQIRIK